MTFTEVIHRYKIIAIARGVPPKRILACADALLRGGIKLLEVTFDQRNPDTIEVTSDMIESLCKNFGGDLFIGAGTVMSASQVAAAADAGAKYIISPNYSDEVVRETLKRGLISIPGVMTPSEMATAYAAGAHFVKLFPADSLGVGYLKSVLSPLSHIPIIVTGGINVNNMCDYLSAGAVGVGVGSNVVDNRLISQGDFDEIRRIAINYTSIIKELNNDKR